MLINGNTDGLFEKKLESSEFFQKIIDNCPVGILVFDTKMNLIALNDYVFSLIGKKETRNHGTRFCDIFICTENEDVENCQNCPIIKNIKSVISSGRPVKNIDIHHDFIKNGRHDVVWFKFSAELYTLSKETYLIAFLADITKQKYLENNLKNLGITDGQTLLYYKKYILEQLEILASDPGLSDSPLSIVMIDIDNLGDINENFGMEVGDEIIRELAKIITKAIRHTDFAGRYGGEEFLLLLPDTKKEGAAVLTERVMNALKEKRFGKMTNPVNFSAGILEINHPDINIDNFLINTKILLLRNKEDRKTGWYSASMTDFE